MGANNARPLEVWSKGPMARIGSVVFQFGRDDCEEAHLRQLCRSPTDKRLKIKLRNLLASYIFLASVSLYLQLEAVRNV